jgi:hypothetical protein
MSAFSGAFIVILSASVGRAGFSSPFPSTVDGLSIMNTHVVGTAPALVLRGMAPTNLTEVQELKKKGINDILIFRNDLPEETFTVAEETKILQQAGFSSQQVHQIRFAWKDMKDAKRPCRQTIQALRLIAESRKGIFFHCTVGEDRTGYLAGLYRILFHHEPPEKVYAEEMCARGYAEGDPCKPAEVSQLVHKNITVMYLQMLEAIEKKQIDASHLNEKVCDHWQVPVPQLQAKFADRIAHMHCPAQNAVKDRCPVQTPASPKAERGISSVH